MKKNPEIIDLEPHQWKSERKKPREPFFGNGLPGFIAYISSFAVTATLVYYLTH